MHVVILNWLDVEATAACLRSLAVQSYRGFEITVVHNGPADAPLARLDAAGVPFRLLRPGRNLGFSGGVNLGIRTALAEGAEFVWLLNSDAEAAPDALAKLVALAASDPRIGLVAPQLRDSDDDRRRDLWGGLVEYRPLSFRMSSRLDEYQRWRSIAPDRLWLSGAALLIRRQLAEAIGFFDETLFAYAEDIDYSIRSTAAGFLNLVAADAIVHHRTKRPDTDVPTKPPYYYYFIARNHILPLHKYGGIFPNVKPLYWTFLRGARSAGQLRRDPETVAAICSGLLDGVRGRGGAYTPVRPYPRFLPRILALIGALLARAPAASHQR